ncbi:MAG: hypothetical protein JST01_17725 [Cyanobacteria bacterium SZAS TMP-1]|nr:hypothetical protein [Cyanobacteria bacterium SZAS TMP-1]
MIHMRTGCLFLSLTATVIAIASTIEVFAPAAYAQDATALPLTRSPIKLDKSAKTVYQTIEASSVVPVTTGTFPDYRQREFMESFEPISAWSKADYAQIQRLRDHSEDFRLLTINQLLAMQSKIGGVRDHGILGQLEQRKAGEDSNTQMLFLTGDNVETFLSVLPPKSKEIRDICSRARGNRMLSLPVTVLKHAYGDAGTEKILKSFYRLEAEKSRPLGWEAFACDVNPQRIFLIRKRQPKPMLEN